MLALRASYGGPVQRARDQQLEGRGTGRLAAGMLEMRARMGDSRAASAPGGPFDGKATPGRDGHHTREGQTP